jgi:hypothetical protein
MRKYLLLLAVAAFFAAPKPASAGWTAATNRFQVDTPDANANNIADVGELFVTSDLGAPRLRTSGMLVSYTPDGATDPQLNNADLGLYGFSLDGTALSVVQTPTGGTVNYCGTYAIRYFDPSGAIFDVSTGHLALNAIFGTNGAADLVGSLYQTAGPSNPAFADLSEGGLPADFNGTYTPTVVGAGLGNKGMVSGTLRLPGVNNVQCVPEPGSLAFLATGLLPLLGLRRRK